jgi:hypothetical protein
MMTTFIRFEVWAATCLFALLAAAIAGGCSASSNPKTYPVKGKVIYRGQPVTGGLVMLVPDGAGHAATGSLEAGGEFQLTTFEKNDGAVPGKYNVAVQVFPAEGAGLPGAEFGNKKPPIPAKYMSDSTSGLTADITAGENNLDFQLKD